MLREDKFPELFLPKELIRLKVHFRFIVNIVIPAKIEGLKSKKNCEDDLLRIEITRKEKSCGKNFRKNLKNMRNS